MGAWLNQRHNLVYKIEQIKKSGYYSNSVIQTGNELDCWFVDIQIISKSTRIDLSWCNGIISNVEHSLCISEDLKLSI